ncbi:hypothetical protein A5791_07540 [Mycobacterium sp. 852002-51163_SCH5372311]|uniref:hypothetical protein n=1 Tax=Mycobacterium sp. 852002-51163_SCH5372311 TaxID=1834097 RepID=UPI0008004186|nr:hypothetical protein [Mycobacterium sp. 852002-51163_SCH5372311]OBF80682.1 hypothetical protein A5791_07540 [Mycobacterium sp. 852002-51163_SCH5372311]
MHVAALLVAGDAKLDEDGALNAWRIPTTSFEVEQIPLEVTIPLVLVVHAQAGRDYDPLLFIVCKDPAGKRQGSIESSWHWPDDDGHPSKYRCFTHPFPFVVSREGEYTIGVYYDSNGIAEMATPIPLSIKLATFR